MSEVTSYNLPDVIDGVRAQGGYIHDLPPEATQLISRYGLYTVCEPRDPGNFIAFRQTVERERMYEQIAERVGTLLGTTETYGQAIAEDTLGEQLTSVFGSITQVNCHNVHMAHAGLVDEAQKGIATAKRTVLTVPTLDHAEQLGLALQGLLATGLDSASPLTASYPVTMAGTPDMMPARVTVHNLDEHAARSLSRSVDAVVSRADKARGVVLPTTKRTYEDWKKAGETFPHSVEQRLQRAAHSYMQLGATATYDGRPDLRPRPKPRIIGHDSAAFFETIRDVFNGLIHDPSVRGGSHHNLEQHPIKQARPLVEAGIDLRRDPATLSDVEHGPLPNRPAHVSEKGIDLGREKLRAARRAPLRAAAKLASNTMSLPTDLLGAAGSAIEYLPKSAETSAEMVADYKEWLRRKALAAAGGERLDELSAWLRRQQSGLVVWEKPSWLNW